MRRGGGGGGGGGGGAKNWRDTKGKLKIQEYLNDCWQLVVVRLVSRSLHAFGVVSRFSLFHSSSNVTPFSCSSASVSSRYLGSPSKKLISLS